MVTFKKIILWCAIAIAYFVVINVPLNIYYRTTGDPPDFLLGLHHEFFIVPFFSTMIGKQEFYLLSPVEQEKVAFLSGLIFYAGTGALLGLLQHLSKKSKHLRGIFYAVLCSMLGYTIGVWIGGHPPILIFLNPPIFFIGGYIFGIMTVRPKTEKNN